MVFLGFTTETQLMLRRIVGWRQSPTQKNILGMFGVRCEIRNRAESAFTRKNPTPQKPVAFLPKEGKLTYTEYVWLQN